MSLKTQYLGLQLSSPLVVGASPFCDNVKTAVELQQAGAGALVMRSLFEEQIEAEALALARHMEVPAESYAEATSYFPNYTEYHMAPDQYLRKIDSLKQALRIPVIASLNGFRPGGWMNYAQRFESVGADAVELNLYQLATRADTSAEEVEADMLDVVGQVCGSVRIPVAVKLSPFHTSPANFARKLEGIGASGVVFFNRFYQPDFDLEELEVVPQLRLSDSSELLLRLRWLAIVSPQVRLSLSASGGVHTAADALKAVFAGAHAVQLVSVLLRHGPQHLTQILEGMRTWMDTHGYTDIDELRGAMNLKRCPDPAAFERANYIRILQAWRVNTPYGEI